MIKPISVIYPEGGEPLYEVPGSGVRLTAQDYAAMYGMKTTEFLAALKEESVQEPEAEARTFKISKKSKKEDEIDG